MSDLKNSILDFDLPEDIKKWWNSVQDTLIDAGYDLSLTNPADTARLFVVTYEKKGYDSYAVKTHYAFDPLMHEIDVNNITEEEILSRQVLNASSMKATVESLYRQAQQGLLFIRALPGENTQTCQLLVGEDGMAKVGNSIDHPSPEELEYTRMIDEPEPPAAPSQAVRDRAAAGDESAQITVRLYEEKLADYPQQVEEWNAFRAFVAQKPEFYNQCRNMVIMFRNYMVDRNLDFEAYSRKLSALHEQTKYDRHDEEERTVAMNRDQQNEAFRRNLSDFFGSRGGSSMKYGAWSSSLSDSFARMLVARNELRRGEEALENGAGRNFIPLSEEQTEQAVNEMKNSRIFKSLKYMISPEDFDSILNAEKMKAAEMRSHMETFCDSLITPEGQDAVRAKWWGKLQQALDRAGCELDLNSPEDLGRLWIFDVTRTGPEMYETVPHFAADPEKKPIDIKTLTADKIMAGNPAGVPDEEVMQHILEAAYEGRLFVLSHKEAEKIAPPRPVQFNMLSNPAVGNDYLHFNDSEAQLVEILEAPEAPEEPSSRDRVRASLGNADASRRIENYNRKQARYERDHAAWERIQRSNPNFVDRARNAFLIGQTYFGNLRENETALRRFEETASKLHRQSEARKMPDNARPAAEDINRHRERIVTMVKQAYLPQKRVGEIRDDEPISQKNLVVLSQLLASQTEIARAQKLMGAGTYRPRTEEEMAELAAEIRAQKRFGETVSRLNGGFLNGLVTAAFQGEKEAAEYLRENTENAYTDAVEGPEWQALKNSMLVSDAKEGTMPDVINAERGIYSTKAEGYVDVRFARYLNTLSPGEEEIKPGSSNAVTEKQTEFLRAHGQEFVDIIARDPLVYTGKFPEDTIQEFIRKMKPDYRPLSPEEKITRAENSRVIREKFNSYIAERGIALAIAMRSGANIDRMLQGALMPGIDTDSFVANENARRIITEGSLEEKRAFYMDTFRRLEEFDMTGINVMNDANLIHNFEKLRPILSVGPEIANLLKGARAVGLDLTGDEYKPLIEKLGILTDTSYMIRARVDVMSHPTYSEIRYEEFIGNFSYQQAHDADGNSFDLDEFFEERGEANHAMGAAISQVGMIQHLSRDNPLFDTSLSPEKRLTRYHEMFWDSLKEVMPEKPNVVFRRGELLEDDADHYNDFEEDAALEGLEDTELSPEMKEAFAEEAPALAQADGGKEAAIPEADPLVLERFNCREKFVKNLELIREIIPDFKMTDEEIDAYLTPERIALHKDSAAQAEKLRSVTADLEKYPGGVASFARLWQSFYDFSGTEEAERKNSELREAITSFSPEINEKYRRMAAEVINNVAQTDPSRFGPEHSIEETGRYALEHQSGVLQGMDFKYFLDNIAPSLGFTVNPQKQAYLDELKAKAENLGEGSVLNRFTANEAFLTMPFEHLTFEQVQQIHDRISRMDEKALPGRLSDYQALMGYVNARETHRQLPEPERTEFSANDLFDRKVKDLAAAKENFRRLSGNLKEDTSAEFKRLRQALNRLDEALEHTEGYLDNDRSSELNQNFQDVYQASREYVRYVSGQENASPAQTRNRYFAQTAFEFSEPYRNGSIFFKALVDDHNRALAEEYYADVNGQSDRAAAAEANGAEAEARERLFTEGLAHTDALRAEVERLGAIEIPEAEELFSLEIGSRILAAREKLTQMVGRENITADELLQPMAEIVQGRRVQELYAGKENGMKSFEILTAHAQQDPAFRSLLQGFTSDDVNKFLAGPGEELLTEKYLKAMLPAAPEGQEGGAEDRELPQDPAEMFLYDKGLQQAAYAEASDHFADALHDKLNEIYGPLEKNTDLMMNRMDFITVEDQSLAALFQAEHDKLPPEKRPLNTDGTFMVGRQMLQNYGIAQAERILTEALMTGKKVSYFMVDPETARINGTAPHPMTLEDIGISSLSGMRDEEQEAAFIAAEEKRSKVPESAEDVRRRAENEHLMTELNYFRSMTESSSFSPKTKKAYFGRVEKENGIKIAGLETTVNRSLSRGGASSLAVAALVCSGFRIEDVLDPTKLLKEKEEIGKETVARLMANDAEWVADINLRGRDILSADMIKRAEKVNFTDPKSIFTEDNQIMGLEAMLCFDLSQDIKDVKQEEPGWFQKNCGTMTPEEKQKNLYARSMNLASFIGNFFTAQEKLLESAVGIDTLPLVNGLSRDICGIYLEKLRKENPGKPISELIGIEDQTIIAPDMFLEMTSPKVVRELKRRKQTDSSGLAKSILDGSFLQKYNVSITMADGIPMPTLTPAKIAKPDAAAEKPAQAVRNLSSLSEIEEESDIDAEFGERMAQYAKDGVDTLTEKQRLEEIRRINEDLKAAGIKPMTEEEMAERASDPKLIQDCLTASDFCKEINRTYEFLNESKKTNRYKVHNALGRSIGYLMDTSGTGEADENNVEREKHLQTVEDVNRVIRETFHTMMQTDESKLFADNVADMIAAFGDDPQKLQICFELHHIMSEVATVKNENGTIERNTFGLEPEEYDQLMEKFRIFENAAGFEQHIRVAASPIHLFLPELSPADTSKLMMYYSQTKQTEKYDYVSSAMAISADAAEEKYAPVIADLLKKAGFLGMQEAGTSYETYDDKGELLSSRNRGITVLSDGSAKSVRFVKSVKQKDGAAETEEITLSRSDVMKLYDRAHLDENLEKAYRPLSKVIFTSDPAVLREQQKAEEKGLPTKKIIFSADPLLLEAEKAALLREVRSPEFKEADRLRQEELYQKAVDDIASGRNARVDYLFSQPREVMDAMLYDFASTDLRTQQDFGTLVGEFETSQKELSRALTPGERAVKGMFLPKTDSSGMRTVFEDRVRGRFVDTGILNAQREADAIEVPIPEGMTAENVTAVVMSCFFTEENCVEGYRINYKDNAVGSTQYKEDRVDPAMGGFNNMVENVIVMDDPRVNLQRGRVLLPEARRKAKELTEKYQAGDPRELAGAADKSLRFLIGQYNHFVGRDSDNVMVCGRLITGIYDLLSRPELKDHSTVLKEVPAEWFECFKQDMKLNREKAALKNDIAATLREKAIEQTYLGKNTDLEASFADDAELQKKILDYEARRLYFDRVRAANEVFQRAKEAEMHGNTVLLTKEAEKRPLSRPQKNMLHNPESYIGFLKQQILAGDAPDYGKALKAGTWEDARKAFQSKSSLFYADEPMNLGYAERGIVVTAVNDFLKQAETDPKLEQLCADLRELPCMKDAPGTAELIPEEMARRAELYEAIAERVRVTDVRDQDGAHMGAVNNESISEELTRVLTKEAKYLRAGIPVSRREKDYETRTAWNEYNILRAGGLDFKAAEEKIAAQNAAIAEELKAFVKKNEEIEQSEIDYRELEPEFARTELRYGRATKDSYLKMLNDLVEKTPDEIACCEEFKQVTSIVKGYAGLKLNRTHIPPVYEEAFKETCQAIEKLVKEANARLMDDDSPEALEKASYVTNLSAMLDAYHDTPELTEAARADNSRLESAYENCLKREKEIVRILNAQKEARENEINTSPVSEFTKLTQLARGSMERVREAIANEAYGLKDSGLAALRQSDDLAILSLFSILSNVPENAPLRREFEQHGVHTAIQTADNTSIIKARKQELTLEKLSRALGRPAGFAAYMVPMPQQNAPSENNRQLNPPQIEGRSLSR